MKDDDAEESEEEVIIKKKAPKADKSGQKKLKCVFAPPPAS